MTHLQSGNSYGIQLKEIHTKFPQPELGPWVEEHEDGRDGLEAARPRGLGEAGRPLTPPLPTRGASHRWRAIEAEGVGR